MLHPVSACFVPGTKAHTAQINRVPASVSDHEVTGEISGRMANKRSIMTTEENYTCRRFG